MKKEISYSIRYAVFFTIVYTLFDLVNWKEVWANFDMMYIVKNVFIAAIVGFTMYLFELNKSKKKKLNKEKQPRMD